MRKKKKKEWNIINAYAMLTININVYQTTSREDPNEVNDVKREESTTKKITEEIRANKE